MGFIGTKLKGLAALIAAAAVTLTALPTTAAAENAEYTVCIAQTGTKKEHTEKADCYYFPEYKHGDFTAPAKLETIAKETGFLDEFYELGDEWTLWGGAYVNALPTVYYGTDTPQYTGLIGTFSTQDGSALTEENARNAAAKGEFFGSDSTPVVLIEAAAKPKTYTFQVYKNFSVSEWTGVDPLFTFETDVESKAFPTEELASRKLPSTVTIAYHYSYEDGEYIYKEKIGSGEAFWNALSEIAQKEKNHGSSIDFSQMAIYYDSPSIVISNQEAFEAGLDYTMFTDSKVTLGENKFIAERSTYGDVWRVIYYESRNSDNKMEMVSGDKLASLIVELKDTKDISLYHYDSIYVVNSLSEGSSVFFTESADGLSGEVDPSAVEKYTLDAVPVYLARATAKIGLKPADAEYDAKFYTPAEWTIWGVMSAWIDDNKTGYLSSSPKQNGKLDVPDDFLFEDMEYTYEPVLQVHSMELKKFNIICAEAEGGKLTYTAADHSAFPTKDGVTRWEYRYENKNISYIRQGMVANSDELWNLVLESTEWDFDFDEGTATLTPADPWDQAFMEADLSTNDVIITVPRGETVIPKGYFEYVPLLYSDKNAVIFKYSNGVEWKIAFSDIVPAKISDDGVDLSVVLNETNLSAAVSGVKNAHYRAEMTVNNGEPFGFEALLTIDLSKAAENAAGDFYANLLDVKNGMTLINYTALTDNAASFTLSQADGLAIIVGFDILDGKTLTDVDIKLTAPVSGKEAAAPTFTGNAVIESVEWSPELVDGKFEKDAEYTVKLNFKAADGIERISYYLNVTLNGSSDVMPHIDPYTNTFFVRYTFPKTDSSSDSDSKDDSKDDSKGDNDSKDDSKGDNDSKDDSKGDNDSKDDSKGDSGSKGSSVSGRPQLAGGGSSSTDSKEPAPSLGGKSASWSEIASDISKMAENSKADIDLNGSAAIPAEVIKAIRDRKIIATVRIDSAKSWIIDGGKITAETAADLSLRAGTSSAKGERGIAGYRFVTAGNSVGAELSVLFKAEHAGKFANLYIIKNGRAEFVSTAKIATDGSVTLGADEKGEYVVMLSDYSDLIGDADNDGKVLITDALAALRHYVGLEKAANPEMLDFNGDGEFTIADAQAILRYAFGMN